MEVVQGNLRQNELKPKVKAMYDAVLQLLDENADVNTMTVADITKKAGIGKGTAYEYFKSKEEIIAGAILYDARKQGEETWEQLDAIAGFEQKIRYCFRWVTECIREQRAFARFLLLSVQANGVREALVKIMQEKHEEGCDAVMHEPLEMLRQLCIGGKESGDVRGDLTPEEAAFLLLGSLGTLVLYLGKADREKHYEPEKMRDLLCEGFLHMVR